MATEVMSKRWQVKVPNPQIQVKLSNELQVHPIISQLLINRQITDVQEAEIFLNTSLSKLHDPFLLKDMDKAVARIRKAKEDNEKVVVFGDYDVDGVASTALLYNVLKELGIEADTYIPHRMDEGYGLNLNIVDYVKENQIKLLISVDCGISAFEVIDELNKNNVDAIIIDHHEPSERLPDAAAIVNPKRVDCSYPFQGLASVGLVAKVIQALLGKVPDKILDMVAIGTIADVAQLRGENRIFVKEGLPKIMKTPNKGLQALMDVAKIKGKKFKPYFVGFILGPRINAMGRMDSAKASLDLLLCDDDARAYELARTLETHNTQRQRMQRVIVQEATNIIENEINFKDDKIIIIYREGWHKGVLGIVASRIVEKYYRPTIVLSVENGVAVGSARSIAGFHLFEALTHCSDFLENYGGHKMAAGLTIKEERIPEFQNKLNEFAQENIVIENLIPTIDLDGEIPLSEISLELVKIVESLEPFGEGNPTPSFCSRGLTVRGSAVIQGKDTLKFWVTDGEVVVQAVGFGMGRYRDMVNQGQPIDVAYNLSIDDWNKDPIVCLKLKDIKENGS